MGKIRVKILGDEITEKAQADKAKARREGKRALKTHVKGVGLKGGQQLKVMEGTELKPEVEALIHADAAQTPQTKKAVRQIKARVHSRRYRELREIVDKTKSYNTKDAIKLIIKTSNIKFDGTVETHININPATLPKDKPSLQGTVNLPHGTGKKRIIAIADDSVLKQIETGKINFDVLVAHPSQMPKLAKFAKLLGPRGLMPNPKNGTVTQDPEKRAQELEGGELTWKTEPDHPVIHQALGKVSFGQDKIEANLKAFVTSVSTGKIAKLTLSSTMGPGIKVDLNSI